MPPGDAFLVGQRAKRPYVHRLSRFFFTELDKGLTSPYILILSGILGSYLAWRVSERLIAPRRERIALLRPSPRVPMQAEHNSLWGFGSNNSQEPSDINGGLYEPQSDSVAKEEQMRRPRLVHAETSELRSSGSEAPPEVICMELPEYDPTRRDDVVYRSVHYCQLDGEASSKSKTSSSSGDDVIHGIVKCRSIDESNNCLPMSGHLEDECSRKLMLSLGPVQVLRDAAKIVMPIRFSFVRQPTIETLVLGLHSGELPRWLANGYPNFNVDVVERDGTLIRLCRRFLGLQETSNLSLHLSDPAEYVRLLSARVSAQDTKEQTKRYDLILVNTMDGSGRLSTRFGQLDFLSNIRNCLSSSGCVAVAVPNGDAAFLYHMVQNWRMAFAGRPVVLCHCMTSPSTVLMTFQDNVERGKAKMGSVANIHEFRDLLRAHLSQYGPNRVPFDFTHEVQDGFFSVLNPDVTYDVESYLPQGHPYLQQKYRKPEQSEGWGSWIRRISGSYLSPSQRMELR